MRANLEFRQSFMRASKKRLGQRTSRRDRFTQGIGAGLAGVFVTLFPHHNMLRSLNYPDSNYIA